MDSGLKISAVAISAKGKGMNLDNIYVNGRYLAPGSDEPQVCISKTSHVDFQMYGVCDGENAEDVALKNSPSALVMQRMQQLQSVLSMDGAISRDKIWNFLCETNAKIREYQEAVGSEGVYSTFAGLFLHKNRGLAVHMGDSRIYVVRGGRMLQITEDHLEATDLYKFGIITQEQAEVHKHESRPTATLGMYDIYDAESEVFSKYFVFYPGDVFILCTDGITDAVSNQEIEQIVRGSKNASKETIAQQLIQLAKDKNEDDKSVIVLEVEEVMGESAAPQAAPQKERVAASPSQPKTEESSQPEEAENTEESQPLKKAGLGASLAALAAKVGGSSVSQEEEQQMPPDEPEEEERPSVISRLKQRSVPKEEPEIEEESDEADDEIEDDDEVTILDKIFGNPKLIFIILASIVAVILLIVLLTSLGSKKPSDNSSASNSSVISSQSSAEDSSKAIVVGPGPVVGGDSSAQDSKVDHNSSKAESSKEESSKEESSVAENSSKADESSQPDESSVPDEDSSYSEPSTTTAATHTIAAGDTYYDILLKYYDEFSEDLLNSFCRYNGITTDTVLQPGDVLKIPPRSEL